MTIGELGGVGLGGPNDHIAADDAAGGGHPAWLDALDGGALEEPDAAPSRGGGDAVDQARRMDDRAMGCEQRSSQRWWRRSCWRASSASSHR